MSQQEDSRDSRGDVSEDRYGLLVEQAADHALFMLDPRGHVLTWNAAAERLNGYRASEIIGQHVSRFYGEEEARSAGCDRELEIATREGRFAGEGWRLRKDGSRFYASVVITTLRGSSDEVVGFAEHARALPGPQRVEEKPQRLREATTSQSSAEHRIALLARLHELTGLLAGASTPEEVADILVDQGTDALRASTGLVLTPRAEGRLELLASKRAPEALVRAFRELAIDAHAPAATAYRTATPQWLTSPEECARASTDLPESVPVAQSVAALPLIVRGAVVAVVAFRFDEPQEFADDERALMESFALQAAQALDRAKAYADERSARARIEAFGVLAQALARASTTEEVARIVVDRGMAVTCADTCTLYLLDDETRALDLIAERGCRPEVIDRIRRITIDSGNPVYSTIATREARWVEDEEGYIAFDRDLATVKSAAPRARSFWSVPLIAEDRPIGLLGMGFYEPRRFPPEERGFVATFTSQCAEALLRAQRLESERQAKTRAEQLRASLSTTLRSIGDAVIATDPKGAVTLMNDVAEMLTGWSEDEARGRDLSEIFHIVNEHTREPVVSPVDKVLELGIIVGLANHTVLVARDGRETPIDDSGAPIRTHADGPIEGVVLVFRDVSEKKREESRRTFLEESTVALVESLDYETTLSKVARLAVPRLADWCAVDLVDPEKPGVKRVSVAHVDPSKVELAKQLQEKYPTPPDAPTGVPNVLRTGVSELYSHIPDELLIKGCIDDEHIRIARALQLRSAMIVPLIARGHTLGALSFVFAESGRNYREDDLRFAEDLAHRCAAAIDNARLYASEQQARHSADIANRAKDEFLAMVSHELRTPLNAIMGWANIMSSASDEARRARAIEVIERNSIAMAQLIEDLLDVSRIISGKMRLEVQQVDVARVIDAAIDSIRPAADAKGIRITASVDSDLPKLVSDPARLQQIVWNLLSNAVKFSAKSGVVTVTLRLADSWFEISVEDTGKGIAARFLPHVFDAFRQEDASFTRSRGGLGLGLAISRQLVELHGGRIEARSDGEGMGATFVVRLPVSAVVHKGPAEAVKGARIITLDKTFERPEVLNGLDVLVVDDEEDARNLVKAILEQCGCVVRQAGGTDEALEAISTDVPDVLISDIGMPDRDGYDLIRQVRELSPERGRDVPAAALTAYARAEDRRRMLNAGFSTHIPKPVEPSELVAVVASLTRFAHRSTRS